MKREIGILGAVLLISLTCMSPSSTTTGNNARPPVDRDSLNEGATLTGIIPDKAYNVKGDQSKLCLYAKGEDKARLLIHYCNGDKGTKIHFTPDLPYGPDAYLIYFEDWNRCLTYEGNNPQPKNPLQLESCSNEKKMRWRVFLYGSSYEIKNLQSGLCVDVDNQQTGNDSGVNQYDCKAAGDPANGNQRWTLIEPASQSQPSPPPSPQPSPPPSPESQLRDESVCGPRVGDTKSCELRVRNINHDRNINARVCWSNAIPPAGYHESCVPLEQKETLFKKDNVFQNPVISGVFPWAQNPATGFHVTSAHYAP